VLNKLVKNTKKKKKRIGRGYGSGKGGHTVGRGTKGQRSRSGYKLPRPGFEGGQMPLSRRIPKLKGFSRGYFNAKKKEYVFNLKDLETLKSGTTLDINKLKEIGWIKGKKSQIRVKICGDGKISKKINIVNIPTSKSAREKITKAGGKVK